MKPFLIALLAALCCTGSLYGDLVVSAPTPDSLMLRTKSDTFDWTVDGPAIWQIIRLLDAETPPGRPLDRLQRIGDALVGLAEKHRLHRHTWHQNPILLHLMLRGVVYLYYLDPDATGGD